MRCKLLPTCCIKHKLNSQAENRAAVILLDFYMTFSIYSAALYICSGLDTGRPDTLRILMIEINVRMVVVICGPGAAV